MNCDGVRLRRDLAVGESQIYYSIIALDDQGELCGPTFQHKTIEAADQEWDFWTDNCNFKVENVQIIRNTRERVK